MTFSTTSPLSADKSARLAEKLDALLKQERLDLGEKDARYLERLVSTQRLLALVGRVLIAACYFSLWFLVPGVLCLALAKIIDNMEIGHNVLHGQYDFIRHPYLNSNQFEWDIACDAKSWQRTHNFEHHTYTNIIGQDRDYGYGLLRLSNDYRWRLQNSWQLVTYFLLSSLFQWGVSYHELAAQRVFFGRKKADRHSQVSDSELKKAFFGKGARQLFKDYLLFPLLCWPVFGYVLLANLCANFIRNWWTATVIFCGHFTENAQVFYPEDCENETRGQWYYRQILGSSNFTGSKLLHILTGHLSCQIEHHLFPDLPAWRYRHLAPQVQAIANEFGIPYNTNSFLRQYLTVLVRIARHSFPSKPLKAAEIRSDL